MRHLARLCLVLAVTLVACGSAGGPVADAPTPASGATSAGAGGAPAVCASEAGLDEVPDLHPAIDGYPRTIVELTSPDGACRIALAVRVADDPTRRAHGLSEVEHLPDGTGMLFTYPDVAEDRTHGYWMKDTLVPLDIAYVARDGTIVDVLAMDPCVERELAAGERCPSYPPDDPWRATLEVPQGWFARVGVTVGWQLRARDG